MSKGGARQSPPLKKGEGGRLIGIFGGTFDPPHLGHEFIIRSLLKAFPFEEIKVIPSGVPPHRSPPVASASHRYKMTSLMIDRIPKALVDEREIVKNGPSYTVDTLSELRGYLGSDVSLVLIVGMDAFSEFPKWHHPLEILSLAHVIVIPRAGIKISRARQLVQETLTALGTDLKRQISDPEKLRSPLFPRVYVSSITPPDISSTLIRQKILQGLEVQSFLPEKVWEYLKDNHLYQKAPARTNPS